MNPRLRGFLVACAMSPVWVAVHAAMFLVYDISGDLGYFKVIVNILAIISVYPNLMNMMRVPINIYYWPDSKYDDSKYDQTPKRIINDYRRGLLFLKEVYDYEKDRENRFIEQVMEQ